MAYKEVKKIYVTESQLAKFFELLTYNPQAKEWSGNVSKTAKTLGFSRDKVYAIMRAIEQGRLKRPEISERFAKPKIIQKYEESNVHQRVLRDYRDPATGRLTHRGKLVDDIGLELFLLFKVDPSNLRLDHFRQAWENPVFYRRGTAQIEFGNASAMRTIMTYAGIDPDAYKEFTTKGLKVEPSKKGWYLEDPELVRYIYAINEPDTLVFSRVGFEGGGRFSSTSLVSTDKIHYDMGMIEMYEPKVTKAEERYFCTSTLDFVRQYCKDFNIIGKLFPWKYAFYEVRFLEAGLKAGLFRYTGTEETKIRKKGQWVTRKVQTHEGKKTSTHLLKHTFVSLASLHGFGLDDVSEQTGTDASTLKQYYLGVGKKKLQGLIRGKPDFVPFDEWVNKVLNPHWVARYNQIKDKGIAIERHKPVGA